jgi:hypothetical protein
MAYRPGQPRSALPSYAGTGAVTTGRAPCASGVSVTTAVGPSTSRLRRRSAASVSTRWRVRRARGAPAFSARRIFAGSDYARRCQVARLQSAAFQGEVGIQDRGRLPDEHPERPAAAAKAGLRRDSAGAGTRHGAPSRSAEIMGAVIPSAARPRTSRRRLKAPDPIIRISSRIAASRAVGRRALPLARDLRPAVEPALPRPRPPASGPGPSPARRRGPGSRRC